MSARDRFEALLVIAEHLVRQRRAHWASVQRRAGESAAATGAVDGRDETDPGATAPKTPRGA